MKRVISLCVVLIATLNLWAGNVITYTATAKLPETTSTSFDAIGLRTNKFNTSIRSHTYSDGVGTVTFNQDVTSIKDYAFKGCSELTSITIPEDITSIGWGVFSGCTSLTSIVWNATNCPEFTTSSMDYTTRAQITSFVIGANVTAIPNYLCQSMNKLTSVNIPNGVTSIGNSAFYDCANLTTISIPSTVNSIGSSAFYNCTKLFSFSIPSSVTTIGSSAFYNIPNIVYSGSATGTPWGAKIINGFVDGNLIYSDNTRTKIMACSPLATGAITIPSTVTEVNHQAFFGCTGLTAVHISDLKKWCSINFGVRETNPLYYAHHLYLNGQEVVNLTIPSGITTIYNSAFYGCHGLQTVTIPSSVTRIWSGAFEECTGLTTVTLPNTITQISNNAFYNCVSLTSINIPNGVTSIGSSAFQGCSSLTSIDVPNSVTSIGDYAFSQVRNVNYSGSASGSPWGANTRNGTVDGYLVYTDNTKTTLSGCSAAATDIVIPGSVTSINLRAFYGCKNLNTVTIPSSVNTISSSAFSGCSGLTSVHIDDIASWCNISFGSYDANPLYYAHHLYVGDNLVTDLVIPEGVTDIHHSAFIGNSDFTSITIPNGVTSIGSRAFEGSSVLTTIEIPSSVNSMGSSVFSGCANLSSVIWNPVQCSMPTNNSSDAFDGVKSQITNFVFGDGVEIIPRHICMSMGNLTSITIPSSVTSIGEFAFGYCSGLETITISENVVNIGEGAFYATDLSSLTCLAVTPPSVASYTFMISSTTSATPNIPVYVPAGSLEAYQNAEYWQYFTDFQEILPEATEYTRTTTAGSYGTICLPRVVAHEDIQGGVFFNIIYAVTNTQDEVTGILMEEETGDLVAGKSYIFRATADELVLPYNGEAVVEPVATNGLVGNLSETPLNVPQSMYVLGNNQLRKLAGGTASVGQNRAYVDLTNVTMLNYVPAAAPSRRVTIHVNESSISTGVEYVDEDVDYESENTQKVLYDGQILIIRDGKYYNVSGRAL